MLEYILIGSGFAFAAAVQPGPFQAFLLSRVAERGWRATLPAALAPVVSDGPIAALALLVLNGLPDGWIRALQFAGALLLLYLASGTFRAWRRPVHPIAPPPSAERPRTLAEAVTVNLLNPNPYLGWSLILGPLVVEAWATSASHAVALVAAFYATLVVAQGGLVILFGAARFLTPRAQRHLVLASAVLLAGIGVYQLASAFSGS